MLRNVHFSLNATRTRLPNGIASAYAHPMSQPDRFKEEISWLKTVGAALIAALVSLAVWLIQKYDTMSDSTLFVVVCGLFGLSIIIAAAVFRLYRCFKILEAL